MVTGYLCAIAGQLLNKKLVLSLSKYLQPAIYMPRMGYEDDGLLCS